MTQVASPFRIYNASAGSGKTYTLAREYLSLLLHPKKAGMYREILAITFTNKAVAELKTRILENLEEFSRMGPHSEPSSLFRDVSEALQSEPEALSRRAARVLQELLHNYAFFDVSTIDKFNHRILRTFARDLQLPSNFEVVIDSGELLQRAVDSLLQKAGEDPKLTRVLIEFALEKSAEDRSWDIGLDLMEMGKLLFSENDLPYLAAMGDKRIDDFLKLRSHLQLAAEETTSEIVNCVGEMQRMIEAQGLGQGDFRGGYLPKFLAKIAGGELTPDFKASWKKDFSTTPLWKKSDPPELISTLQGLRDQLSPLFDRLRTTMFRRSLLMDALKNSAPFTVLGMLRLELQTLQREEQLLPVGQFNSIISQELSEQPAPYIYERLGEKYRHYFIDEFQDTSLLQWNNLIPLIANALQSEDEQGRRGSLILVGDAKQAIYRWRGGRAEQFIDLLSGKTKPFHLKAEVKSLPKNYRSYPQVIEFNNDFFVYLSAFLGRGDHEELFRDGSRQMIHAGDGGLVSLEFIEAETEDVPAAYTEGVLRILEELTAAGYPWGDICVLTRKRKEGVAVSNALIESGIPVLSSETLLLKNNPTVQFLISLLGYLQDPKDPNPRLDMLLFLAPDGQDVHRWITTHIESLEILLRERFKFDPAHTAILPTYEILEIAIRQFALEENNRAYLIFLLDLAQEIALKEDQTISAFLNYWERKQDEISLKAPEHQNAVRLMTIHKSKGLEFPIVIFPFADASIYAQRQGYLWASVPEAAAAEFPYVQISKRKETLEYGPEIAGEYLQDQENMELDAINVMYVAHTRAQKALFVLSKQPGKDPSGTPKNYADWYVSYLSERGLWDLSKLSYRFGSLPRAGTPRVLPEGIPLSFQPSHKDEIDLRLVTRSGEVWATGQGAALEFGNLLHYAMSLVEAAEDIPAALDRLIREGELPQAKRDETQALMEQLVTHPQLKPSFEPGQRVLNERDIIAKNGVILRPDRLVLREGRATLIDYKTGQPLPKHHKQLEDYARAVAQMGYEVERAMLVYLKNETITIEQL